MYAFVVTLLVYRSITWANFRTAVVQSVRTTSMVMILIACAAAFGYMLTFYRVPSQMVELLTGITDNPILILLMINAVLLLLGMIMDMAALILFARPDFLPVANSLGMDPLQFGMMMLVNLGLACARRPWDRVCSSGVRSASCRWKRRFGQSGRFTWRSSLPSCWLHSFRQFPSPFQI